MKKVIIVIASLLASCILLTGIFSAGLVVGGLILADRDKSEVSQISPSNNNSVESGDGESKGTSSNQPDDTPVEEETSFLSELNPFKSDEVEDPPPPELF